MVNIDFIANQTPLSAQPFVLKERYEIVKTISTEGGFGITYLARDRDLPGEIQCVVKKLKLKLQNPELMENIKKRFEKEALHLQTLGKHEFIPELNARFTLNGEMYIVQEYIEGKNLRQELSDKGCWNKTDILSFLKDILNILIFVHDRKIIHRDIKPANIIRRKKDGKLVLIDFGIVKQITTDIQQSTMPVGTPGYMSKEQGQGNPVFASDIYSVGIVCIQGLTNRVTNAPNWHENCKSNICFKLKTVIDKMITESLKNRYQTAREVLHDVELIESEVEEEDNSDSQDTVRQKIFKGLHIIAFGKSNLD